MRQTRKLSFQEAWDSSTIFFVDEQLEEEIKAEVNALLETARGRGVSEMTVDSLVEFLTREPNALDVILKDLELSQEKFMRIVSLLRKLRRIPGGFEQEWGISKIKSKLGREPDFARLMAQLLFNGKEDAELQHYVPRYYLMTLDYRGMTRSSDEALQKRYKGLLIGTYGARKGYKVEDEIRQKLTEIQKEYGVGYDKGRSAMVDTDIDFAVPSLEDPWVIIMSSFQETTSSGQTTKARDMLAAYERVRHRNSRYRENRAFVNFIDGGGWLARKRDMQRLVEECHYFVNLQNLDMLEGIILKHVPRKHFRSRSS